MALARGDPAPACPGALLLKSRGARVPGGHGRGWLLASPWRQPSGPAALLIRGLTTPAPVVRAGEARAGRPGPGARAGRPGRGSRAGKARAGESQRAGVRAGEARAGGSGPGRSEPRPPGASLPSLQGRQSGSDGSDGGRRAAPAGETGPGGPLLGRRVAHHSVRGSPVYPSCTAVTWCPWFSALSGSTVLLVAGDHASVQTKQPPKLESACGAPLWGPCVVWLAAPNPKGPRASQGPQRTPLSGAGKVPGPQPGPRRSRAGPAALQQLHAEVPSIFSHMYFWLSSFIRSICRVGLYLFSFLLYTAEWLKNPP